MKVLEAAEAYARAELGGDSGGHDWWHVHRVRNLAVELAREEDADRFLTELAALLHDIGDFKLSGSLTAGEEAARRFCTEQGLSAEDTDHVAGIVADLSYKGAGVPDAPLSLEGRCVRDADRLDAMGAIGIGRAFAYGGLHRRAMWDPEEAPRLHATETEYRSAKGSTIAHFHEKLLLLKGRMSTDAGARRAEHRHGVLVAFVNEFMAEWDGEDGRG
ncbi:HD domain-containing protein [Glycomyces harbinensis]|uniref:HD domain-containing protein n=1 Tax=Glycomyces harbinensis TaxID=58114 RepID=UPI0015A6EF77|nr:HD domain-containing protein [Glycomyces harbinensis]